MDALCVRGEDEVNRNRGTDMRRVITILAVVPILLMFTGAARAPQQVNWEALDPAFSRAANR